jgi:hypothetical protein
MKIGDCLECELLDYVDTVEEDTRWEFIIINKIKFKRKTYFVAVKNCTDDAEFLCPSLFDEYGHTLGDDMIFHVLDVFKCKKEKVTLLN